MELTELIKQVDIVEYISQYVDLEQRGEEWWGLSCFKDEKTPSFSVRKSPPVFYDYSSGIGGNLFTFIKRYFKCSNRETVERIKQYAGYDGAISLSSGKMAATKDCKKFERPKRQTKASAAIVLPEDYMERYERREDKLLEWTKEGISMRSLDRFQVRYDGVSNRLVYPIRNYDGKIVNIGGRTLDPDFKEKEIRKYTYFFPWGTVDTIYGIAENQNEIAKNREIILFEGCKSVLLADSWGIGNTGAILTSHLNPSQMKILAKLGCRVVFALDKDVDPTLDKNIRTLKSYVNIEIIRDTQGLLSDKDSPVDKGKETFLKLYGERKKFR